MAYTEKLRAVFDSTSAVVLTSAAVIKKFAALRPMYVRKVAFAVGTTCVSSGTIVVKVKKYVVFGSAAGAVDLATLNIPATQAAGGVIYKDLASSQKLMPGEELVFEVTTAAAGGGAAGAGVCMFDADDNPETSPNESNLIASA